MQFYPESESQSHIAIYSKNFEYKTAISKGFFLLNMNVTHTSRSIQNKMKYFRWPCNLKSCWINFGYQVRMQYSSDYQLFYQKEFYHVRSALNSFGAICPDLLPGVTELDKTHHRPLARLLFFCHCSPDNEMCYVIFHHWRGNTSLSGGVMTAYVEGQLAPRSVGECGLG